MISRLLAIFLLLVISARLQAQQSLTIIKEKTAITFDIKNFALKVNGTFSGLEGKIFFDENNPSSGSFDVGIPANSVNTNNKSRDKHLRSEDYFEVDKYPRISFRSESIAKSESSYEVTGLLTVKNITKEVSIPFTYKNIEGISEFNGRVKLNRLDYGVGKPSWVLGDEVNIRIKVVTR